ncbi:MAG: outer membrane beta-barrel protein [Bryobacteraceae bacterium]|jgi:hypothetical protein
MRCFRQTGALCLGLSFALSTGALRPAAAQEPPAASQPGEDQKPLTPEEQREKEIRRFDPLDKSNPALDQDGQNRNSGDSTANAATAPQTPAQVVAQPRPLPGSVAAGSPDLPANPRSNEGPQVVAEDADAAAAQAYNGPAVLSRSYTLSRPMTPQEIKWSWNVGFNAIYSDGLIGGQANANGTVANQYSFGQSATWGFHGRHFWKHDQIGVNYSGSYHHYDGFNGYSGQNENLNADFAHEFSRHFSLHLIESGLILSQSYSLENPLGNAEVSIANINLAASPAVQILGTGIRQTNTSANLTWQKSARLSFSYGGGFFIVEQTGAGLTGVTGYQAQSDINYRLTRKMTVGAYYSFSDYVYAQHVDVSEANTFGGIFSYALSRTMQFRSRAGVTRSETNGLSVVPIDPTIAALIGESSTIIESGRVSQFSDISAQLAKDFGRSRTANVSYAHGLAPGNGLILSSVQQTISAACSMRLFREYTASITLGQSSVSSTTQTIGKYTSEYVTLALARSYRHGMSTNLTVSYRRFTLVGGPSVPQSQIYISSGFSWGPPAGRLW